MGQFGLRSLASLQGATSRVVGGPTRYVRGVQRALEAPAPLASVLPVPATPLPAMAPLLVTRSHPQPPTVWGLLYSKLGKTYTRKFDYACVTPSRK